MISFIVATAFIILTTPAWIAVGVIKGLFIFIVEFVSKGWWLIKNTFFVEYKLGAGDVLVSIFAVPINAIWQGLVTFFGTIGSFWDWARYDHPWWAFFICLGLSFLYFFYLPSRSRLDCQTKVCNNKSPKKICKNSQTSILTCINKFVSRVILNTVDISRY